MKEVVIGFNLFLRAGPGLILHKTHDSTEHFWFITPSTETGNLSIITRSEAAATFSPAW